MLVAAVAFAALMIASLVVAVAFPEVVGGTKDVPLSGLGETTDDGTSSAWLRAAAGFALTAGWMALLVYQIRKGKRRRTPPMA